VLGDTRVIAAAIACIAIAGFSIGISMPLLVAGAGSARHQPGLDRPQRSSGRRRLGCGCAADRPDLPALLHLDVLVLVADRHGCCFMRMYFSPFWAWFPLRFVFVFAATLQFVIGEYWINAAADENKRGLVLGIYATVLSIGFAGGPVVLASVGSTGALPFAIASLVMLVAIGPLSLPHGRRPKRANDPP
jgi:hypothetical protein